MVKWQGDDLELLYDAATLFVDAALRRQDSMFTPGKPVWRGETIEDLYQRFVKSPDVSSSTFEEKLQRQLAGGPADSYQLAAEVLFVHLLPARSTGGARKRELVNTVLGWSPAPVELPTKLARALDTGLVGEGVAFKTHRPHLLAYLLEFARRWRSLGDEERAGALNDPWAFKVLVFSLPMPKARNQAEILLHLVHPRTFEDITSWEQKELIAQGFASLVTEPTDDVDRKLLQIRESLRRTHRGDLSFWDPELLSVWKPGALWDNFVRFAKVFYGLPNFDESERDYKLRLAEAATPIVEGLIEGASASRLDQLRKVLRSRDQNLVRWQDYDPFVAWCLANEASASAMLGTVADRTVSAAERVRAFLSSLPAAVVDSAGNRTALASFFLFVLDPVACPPFRATPFDWACKKTGFPPAARGADEGSRYDHALRFLDRFREECGRLGLALRDRLDAQGVLWAMAKSKKKPEAMAESDWQAFLEYREGIPPDGDNGDGPSPEELVRGSMVGRLVLRRKNVVLYGPPGTGKTHASLKLAEAWREWQGDDSVWQVTFHPTLSYEDFVEGFRPDVSGRFELRAGIFVKVCRLAAKEPERQFLLLVDELNRGDVARILGELITLIEADKRHSGAKRTLPYSQEELWVPENLHVLGTMNTADRSISLLDIAIRRRFCFLEFRPDPEVLRSSPRQLHVIADIDLCDLMRGLNARLLRVGVDRDRAVGHSHFMIPTDEPNPLDALRERFRYDIVPLVEEYCYSNRGLMREVFGQLVSEDGLVNETVLLDDGRLTKELATLAAEGASADGEQVRTPQ
ncbi:MAG: AAA family ATPase [Thermoanaerobaculaceae bacterium]|jgi:hypothetical protein|nr:AAA family ATPase [Thermoanaerobaculaceae bacterium]